MIVLYWLAIICLGLFAWLMAAVPLCIAWHLIRDGMKRRHYATVPRAPATDRLDSMAEVYQREDPPQNHAWPPATTTAPGLFVSSGVHPCGCVVETTPEGARLTPCQIHDDDFVSEWEGRLQL